MSRRPVLSPEAVTRLTRIRHTGPMRPGDPRHGTDTGYVAGCRDACCRVAHAARRRRDRYHPTPKVDALGVRRRVEGLACLGYSSADLSRMLGKHRTYVRKASLQTVVQRETFEIIAALYDGLCMRPLPDDDPQANRIRAWARRQGFVPPLAWDDIDDPQEQPTDWAYTGRGRRGDRHELLTDLVESGAGLTAALNALGLSRGALERWAERHGRRGDYVTLARRESPAREAS